MVQEQIKQLYVTPEVGVYETKVKAVICQSDGGINSMEMDEDGGNLFS